MRKDIAGQGTESTVPTFKDLESFVRGRVQGFIQSILDEEVTELLGREKSERIEGIDAVMGYRNGHGKPRKLTMSSGTITVRRPRVRDLEELMALRDQYGKQIEDLTFSDEKIKQLEEKLSELFATVRSHAEELHSKNRRW